MLVYSRRSVGGRVSVRQNFSQADHTKRREKGKEAGGQTETPQITLEQRKPSSVKRFHVSEIDMELNR